MYTNKNASPNPSTSVGAGALVIVGAGISRLFVADDASNLDQAGLEEQMAHMRRVRMRNLAWAEREARKGGGRRG